MTARRKPTPPAARRQRAALDPGIIDLSMFPAEHDEVWVPVEELPEPEPPPEIDIDAEFFEPRTLRSSWDEVDIGAMIDAGIPPEAEPSVFTRTDGPALLYQGKVSSIAGPPESAKGWFAIAASRQELLDGQHVFYVDFEDSPEAISRRMLQVGVPEDYLRHFFHVVNPIERFDPKDPKTGGVFFRMLVNTQPTLVVLDGLTQALSNNGLDDNKNTDVVQWFRELPRKIITATVGNAAILIVDHVTKADDAAKRYALGAGQKLAALDGSQFKAKMVKPFAPGQSGRVEIRVTKDRPGNVRANAWGDNVEAGQVIASMELESIDGPDHFVKIRLWPAGVAELRETPDKQIVSTRLMDDMMRVIQSPGQTLLGRSQLYRLLRGNNGAKVVALNELLKDSKLVERKEEYDKGPLKLYVNPEFKEKKS